MATKVEFKFDLDQEVNIKPIGKKGIVDMLSFDDAGVRYFIKTADHSDWWKEKNLEEVEQNG